MTSFIEAYLHKAESHAITFEDFNNFYKLKLDESQTLEYKSGELLVGYQGKYVRNGILDKEEANKGFIKLATSVAGFANAIGGLFILGVKEIQVKKGGQTVRKQPGAIFPVPDNIISKEMIGSKLRELIRLSIDDLIILPLRTTKTGNHSIYLIDVPQSFRVPHRVNELDYPQRNNFETIPMLHHQISDLFGKRLAPDLDLIFQKEASDEGLLKVRILIRNQGRAVAKYVTGVCSVVSGSYEVIQTDWQNRGENSWQFATGFYSVVYPEVHFDTGTFSFKLLENATEKSLSLRFGLYAEGMTGKSFLIPLVPNHFP